MAHAPDETPDQAWSIRRVLAWAADDFRRRGFDSPRLDAELLLSRALGIDRVRLIMDAHRPLDESELAHYRALIQRRRRAEPIAYILGEREFYGLTFKVDSRALIPRPDTEGLVEVALERTRHRSLFGRALDLCTGSGCVAVAFAKRRPTWKVIATDLSPACVELARYNALCLGAIWGVSFHASDLDESLPGDERFDLVTANPPYIPRGEIAELDRGIKDYEPRQALDGGPDGLDLVRRVIQVAWQRLEPGGIAALEVGAGQAELVAGLFEKAGMAQVQKRRDYAGIERVVSGRR